MTLDEILTEIEKMFSGKTLDERLDACREIGMRIGGAPKPGAVNTKGPMPIAAPKPVALPKKVGFDCYSCGTHNPDAEANQSNGTYLCYNCRC